MSATVSPEPLLSVRDAAARLAVSTATVRRWIAEGDLPALRIGASIRVDPHQLADWLEHRKVAA